MELSDPGIEADALAMLVSYDWPGNVRELLHALEYSVVISGRSPISWSHLPPAVQAASREPKGGGPGANAPRALRSAAPRTRAGRPRPSREQILDVLAQVGGVRTKAAEVLGISRMTLWKWMREAGVEWPPPEG